MYTRLLDVALLSLIIVHFGYAHSLNWCMYVEVGTKYESLQDALSFCEWPNPKKSHNVHSPREYPCAAKSCIVLSSRLFASSQMVYFSVFQQVSTQSAEILQACRRNVVIVGGMMSGGSRARMEDGCARSISSFNFEASKINWWTWLKESWGYSRLKLTRSCKGSDITGYYLLGIYSFIYSL